MRLSYVNTALSLSIKSDIITDGEITRTLKYRGGPKMTEKKESDKKVVGGPGITAGGNVTFGNVNGQVAIGKNISQNQVQILSTTELEDLRKTLLDIQKGLFKLDLPSDDQNIINGDISAAIKESKKEEPELSKIKTRFESFIDTVKGAKKTIKDISELYEPAKKIAPILGVAISALI